LKLQDTIVVKVFFSYSHKDESLRDALETHLSMLKNQGTIQAWHDRRIGAGNEIDSSIDRHLDDADIILLLISPDFLASSYCWGIEVKRAMERHEAKAARVIPVILRACDWHSAPFGKLMAAPKDGKPVRLWPDLDEAFYDGARQIRVVAETIASRPVTPATSNAAPSAVSNQTGTGSASLATDFQIYCSRCGAAAGSPSTCTGTFMHHNFVEAHEADAYCARCGASAGKQSICTGTFMHHSFVGLRGTKAYCSRCGALAGRQSTCTGTFMHHNFVQSR
jgi:hypothetical protein